MRKLFAVLAFLLFAPAAFANNTADGGVIVYGKADGKAPGWAIMMDKPAGWASDCCTYASAIGVNLVLYQGDWTGKPDRVIVLNVWSSAKPNIDADVQDDRKHYLQSDPGAKSEPFAVKNPKNITCEGVLYHGTDHIDDAVVFCDPGKATGIRYSWSVTIAVSDAKRQEVLDTFKQAVQSSMYMKYAQAPSSTSKAASH
jgi:hypothetical protein